MQEKISIVIPTYNEINNIPKLLDKIQHVMEKITPNYEILIVDDNSPDGTGKFVEKISETNKKIRAIIRKKKTGLGDAYKYGFQFVTGDIIFSMDADLSHNPDDFPKFLKGLKYGDVVVGSRYIKGGGHINCDKRRIIISRVANILASFFFHLHLTDCTSGFRVYRRKVIETIMPYVNCQKYTFLVEMLENATRFNFKISEVPIYFRDRVEDESKFNISEVLEFLKVLLRKILLIDKAKRKN